VNGGRRNPIAVGPIAAGRVEHPRAYRARRFWNWFPLGLAYAFLYMGRYNITVAKPELEGLLSLETYGTVKAIGTWVYACAFLVNGPLTDRIGGKRATLLALGGAALANLAMGIYLRSTTLSGTISATSLGFVFGALYSLNMYFQSFGAVSIVKVNSAWFHVRERGGFSGIFGTMISAGLLFAFDANSYVLDWAKGGLPAGAPVPVWILFFLPAGCLAAMFAIEALVLRNHPSEAGLADIETGEATLGDDQDQLSAAQVLWRIITHPVVLTVALIELCTGALRSGVQDWFYLYAKAQVKTDSSGGWLYTSKNWGAIQFVAGVVGANLVGWVSDRVFQSRRAPSAAILYGLMIACIAAMIFALGNGWVLGSLSFCCMASVLGIHGLLSGTATMDFGGRRGTATAVGMIDGFVYLGSGIMAYSLGHITDSKSWGWSWWPPALLPFAIFGFLGLLRIWNAMPRGRRAAP
jgi:OPA family glycerol-3-phosphate transporter-like MFS transporter